MAGRGEIPTVSVKTVGVGHPTHFCDNTMNIEKLKNCPECGVLWEGDDIYEAFCKMRAAGDPYYKDKTDVQLQEIAGHYGWQLDKREHFTRLVGIELSRDHPKHYDGVSFWMCPECKVTWNRFTNEKEAVGG